MSAELYQRCPACEGTLGLAGPAMAHGLAGYTGPLPAGSPCPCTHSPTPGWAKVGLTVGQVERVIENRDRLLGACKAADELIRVFLRMIPANSVNENLVDDINDTQAKLEAAVAAAEGGAK